MALERLKIAVVGNNELAEELICKLENESNILIETLGSEKIIKGEVTIGQVNVELTYISNATEISMEDCGNVLVLFNNSNDNMSKIIEQAKMNGEEVYGYSSIDMSSSMNGISTMNIIPPMPTVLDILFIIRNTKKNRLPISAILELKEIEENARDAFKKQKDKQEKQLKVFSKPIEEALKNKITEESLLLGEHSSEEIENVHWTDEEDENEMIEEIEQKKDVRKRTGQMVFGSDGKLSFQPEKKKKLSTSKPKTKK